MNKGQSGNFNRLSKGKAATANAIANQVGATFNFERQRCLSILAIFSLACKTARLSPSTV